MANSKLGTDQTSATRPFQPWILSTICLSATAILAACSFFTDDKDLVLVASVKYSPMRWLDAQYGPAKAFGFKIASSAQVVLGNAGNQYATLSWVTPDGKKGMCRYKGGSSQAKPTSKKELEKAQYYNLDNCSDNLKANDVVSARMLSFHIDNGGNPGKGQETAAAIKVGITSAPAPTPTPTKTPTVKPEPSPVPTASPSPAPTPVWQSQGWGGAGAAPVSLPGATAINPQVGTHLGSSVAFLYQGANPIQKDVNPGSIDVLLAGVVRGIVKDGNGAALAGVKVSALGRPDLGYTLSRADGGYDFVVNGGENYTLDYSKTGSFASHRVVRPEVNNFVFSADVMLVAQSAVVTKITSSTSNFQIARGEAVTDKDGTRQINLLVPPATTFEAVKADGSRVSFDSASIRITEFTVGANGPARMPATLPANSGYTFAAEFSADEGSGVAAQSVEFSQPMPVYLDNFLSYPLGTLVPSGYYDRQRGEWVPSEDGVVAKVLSVTNGLAQITWHSDGTPLSSAEKDLAGVTDAELRSVAGLYAPGKLLWRMRISHFTPWDFNQPVYVRDTPERQPGNAYNGCRSGSGGKCEPEGQPDSKPNCQSGSIIECENQTAREQVEIAGTGVQLTYSSAEQLGYTKPYTARIPITGPSGVPSDAKEVRATITIAGRQFVQTFTNLGPNYSILFTWDGLDAYGRRLDGTFSLKAEVSFYYNVVTLMGQLCVPNTNDPLCTIQVGRVASFAQAPGSQVSPSDSSRATLPFTKTHVYKIGVSRAGVESASLGGWRLSAHNSYDLGKGELIRGDGTRLGSEGLSVKTKTLFAAPFTTCTPLADFQDGMSSASLCTLEVLGLEMKGADLLVNTSGSYRDPGTGNVGSGYYQVFRITPDKKIYRVAVAPGPSVGNGVNQRLILGAFGRILLRIDLSSSHACYKEWIGGNQFTPFLGNCEVPQTVYRIDDGMQGTEFNADSTSDYDIAFSASGDAYFKTIDPSRSYPSNGLFGKRDRMGRVWKIQTRPQTPANEAEFGRRAVNSDLAMPMRVASDGTIYFTTGGSDICVSRITPVGQLEAFLGRCDTAGNFQNLGINQPIPPGTPRSQISALDMRLASYFLNSRDEFYFDSASQGRGGFGIFKVGLDGLVYPEILQTTDNSKVSNSDGASLTQIQHPIRFLAFASDRHLFLYNGSSIFETLDPLPGFNAADLTVLEEEGQEAHRLSPFGRHLATRDLFLGIDLLSLNYSSEGRLSNIVDVNGRTLRIVRDSSGIPSQIIAPNGEATQLVLNAAGLLSSVSLPGGRQYAFTYASGGLITRFQNPRGLASTYTFETDGRLRTASKADGGSQTFARTEAETGIRVQRTSPTGRVSLYDTLPGNVKVLTSPTGEVTRIENNAGQISQIFANGSSTLQLFNGDPRNLGGAQVPAGSVAKLPGGQVRSESLSTVYSGLSAINPEDFTNYSISSSVNGRTENTSFDKAARTWNFASAAGRNAQSVLTPKGQVSSTTPHTGLIAASAQTFDSLGRLTSSVQGNLSASYSYDALDRVTAAQNAAGEVSRFEYDAASRVTAMVSPEGKRTLFTYDANNNVTSVKLPSGSTHTQGYSVTDLHTAYASPGATQDLGKSYNLEQELTRLTLSGTGRVFDVTRDAGGHVVGSAAAESSQVFTYADATGRVVKATNTQGSNSQVSQFTYNGPLVTAFSTSGAANSVFTYTFDNDFWVSNIVFDNGTVNLPIVRDGDGLMTQYGDFTLDRSGPLGAPVSISQGNGQWQKSYDNLGRLQTEALKVSGNVKLQFDYAYNTAGRLVSRTETDSTGNVRTVLFTYDRDGQLLGVSENGVSTEANVYDVNGNRTSRKVGANTRAATYDAKDRLIAQGGVNYVFDADGFVRTRGADTFTYGTRGELLSANVGGVAVSYVYDTQARLVARIQGSNKIEYLYGNLGEPFQLTAVKDAGVLTYHHYDPSGRLMAFDRGGVRYFVQTDQVGTPRVITDAAGNVVKQIRTSAFGEVLSDSAPAFKMYVGYAGGISDSLTGFVRFGFRDFEPLSGRWTARDPILFQGGQGNLYVYVGNGPVIQRDPDGLYFVPAIGAAVGGTLAGLDSYNHGDSPGTIAKKVAVGAVAGAIGTLPIPGLGAIAAGFATGAAAGFGQNLANQAIDKNAAGCGDSPLDFGTAGISGLVGGAAGALGSAAGYTRTPGTSGGTKPLFPEYRGSGQGNRDGINSAGNVLGGVSGSIGDYFAHKYFP